MHSQLVWKLVLGRISFYLRLSVPSVLLGRKPQQRSMNKLVPNQDDPFKHADVLFKYSSNVYLFIQHNACLMLPSEIRYMPVKQNCQNNNLGFFVWYTEIITFHVQYRCILHSHQQSFTTKTAFKSPKTPKEHVISQIQDKGMVLQMM